MHKWSPLTSRFSLASASVSIVLVLIIGALLVLLCLRQALGVQSVKLPTLRDTGRGVTLFDRYDHVLCTLHADRDRQPVPLSSISVNMKNALLAAEDRHFYYHPGIDPSGIVRALWSNFHEGRVVAGGSTITQQLVRGLYLDKTDRSFKRKMKEAFLAWDVDHQYSKAKILETYLNEVYFGGGVYGIERAAEHYFNKRADHLTIPESAFLAGIIKSPSILGAPENRKLALEREQTVIQKMAEYGFISKLEASQAQSTPLVFKAGRYAMPYPYYVAYVMQVLQRKLGDDLWKYNWNVYTHLDVKSQQLAEATMLKGIKSAPRGIDQGALVTMSVKDGAVLAIVGGVGKADGDHWNRALYPHTAGSSFKPFVYLAGLTKGIIVPDTVIDDAPLVIETEGTEKYIPRNFDGKFMGWIPARLALALSRNVCSARIAQEVGMANVIEVAHAAGIKSQLEPYPSLALGSCALSPLEVTTAYATLARGGVYMEPQLLRRIQSNDAKQDRTFQATPCTVFPVEEVSQLVDALQDVVRCGTGTRAALSGIAVAGKTGTADNGKDIWFVGFTPDTVTAVWGGSDKNLAVKGAHVTGGDIMAHIWHDFMNSFYRLHRPPYQVAFAQPANKLINADDFDGGAAMVDDRDSAGDMTTASWQNVAGSGIARAADLQRSQALTQMPQTVSQSEATDGSAVDLVSATDQDSHL